MWSLSMYVYYLIQPSEMKLTWYFFDAYLGSSFTVFGSFSSLWSPWQGQCEFSLDDMEYCKEKLNIVCQLSVLIFLFYFLNL